MNSTLENLVSTYLDLTLDKSCRDKDFSMHPLLLYLQRYLALDALVLQKLGKILKAKQLNGNNSAPLELTVNYMIGRKITAIGTLAFVSSNSLQT